MTTEGKLGEPMEPTERNFTMSAPEENNHNAYMFIDPEAGDDLHTRITVYPPSTTTTDIESGDADEIDGNSLPPEEDPGLWDAGVRHALSKMGCHLLETLTTGELISAHLDYTTALPGYIAYLDTRGDVAVVVVNAFGDDGPVGGDLLRADISGSDHGAAVREATTILATAGWNLTSEWQPEDTGYRATVKRSTPGGE